ncbi:ribosomal protein L10-domain-containing protein [Cytidiella melzeri]|nr:ribosomal protein L10-domain-containing protein [Cytidiella melzeri]
MPKSKRAKLVSLTKVSKKTKEHKGALISEVQQNADKYDYCWLFDVGNMRNEHLKIVRNLWKDSARIFFGRGAVMAKALGTSVETEHLSGLHKISKNLKGQVGILFTSSPPSEVTAWFDDFHPQTFLRSGSVATSTYTIPPGPILSHHSSPPEPFPHNEEPQLRKLGLHTKMVRGVPTLDNEHIVVKKGETLSAEQAQILKLVGIKMGEFRVRLRFWWEKGTGEVTEVEGSADDTVVTTVKGDNAVEESEGDGDESMDE